MSLYIFISSIFICKISKPSLTFLILYNLFGKILVEKYIIKTIASISFGK